MKKLILAVCAAGLVILSTNIINAEGVNLASVEEMTPVYRTPKRGDRLWDYVRQYNLGHPREIVEFNKGKVGEKCIKSENLILRDCAIAIPVYTKAAVQVQQTFNEKVFEKVVKQAQETKEAESRTYWGLLAIAVIFLGGLALLFFKFCCAAELENERLKLGNVDLSGQLWAAEDKFKNEEDRAKRLSNMLQESYDAFSAKDRALKRAQIEIARMADCAKVPPGSETELEFKEK